MMPEQKREATDPLIVEPQEFLSRPFEKLEVGELAQPPDVELLKYLPTLPDETGLVYQKPRWFVIKASSLGVPSWIMPGKSDILLHSHPMSEPQWAKDKTIEFLDRLAIKDFGEWDNSLPSEFDFGNCSETAKNFLVSIKGITQYWPIFSDNQRLDVGNIQRRFGGKILRVKEYLSFLTEIGARYVVYPWKELDDKKLETLFYCEIAPA